MATQYPSADDADHEAAARELHQEDDDLAALAIEGRHVRTARRIVANYGHLVTTACASCGLVHEMTTEEVVIGRDARERLGRYVGDRGWRRVLLVSDANTADALGDELAADLSAASHSVDNLVFPARSGLVPDGDAVGAIRDRVAAAAPEAMLAVGSGVINDVTRYASFLDGRPYVAVPTAPSMHGYAATSAAMELDGVKVTLPTHAPVAVFADPAVLASAPPEMIVWGLGDLLATATARFDWLLASAIADEPYCELVAARLAGPLEVCVGSVKDLLGGDEDAVVALTTGLVECGIAMAMVNSARPASGCEHLASHFLDLLAYRELRAPAPHGLQVGFATRYAAAIQRAALSHLDEPLRSAVGGGAGDEERRWFADQYLALGPVRDEKQMWFARHGDRWPGDNETVTALRDRLAGLVAGFGGVERALDAAGILADGSALGIDDAALRATFRFANRMRSPFTVLDLLESQHRLATVLDDVLAPGTVPG